MILKKIIKFLVLMKIGTPALIKLAKRITTRSIFLNEFYFVKLIFRKLDKKIIMNQ